MRFWHLFNIPGYISKLEHEIFRLNIERESTEEILQKFGEYKEDSEKAITLLKGKIETMEKFFTSSPSKNDIEEKQDDEVIIDENFQIPMIDGLKMRFENDAPEKAKEIKIYGPRQNQQTA